MDAKIDGLYLQLEEIDNAIVDMLRERAGLVSGFDGLDGAESAALERRVLASAADRAGDELSDCAEAVFRAVTVSDRSLKNRRAGLGSKTYAGICRAMVSTPPVFPAKAVVACQGVEGAYSQIACEGLFHLPSIMYFDSFEHVFRAVEAGMCRYGVLPIENSTAGSVNAIYDLMIRHNFSIVRSVRLRVSHCLLARPGADIGGVKEIFSHQQAIDQCAEFLASLGNVKVTAVENTAAAAKLVSESGRTDVAALASRSCAAHYGLEVLRADAQDSDSNYTRFICISKEPEIYPGADRISLMMILPHRPGSLYSVVSKFNSLGLNLLKLESRPLPGRDFEFMFYFDIGAPVTAPQTESLFRDLEAAGQELRYLGAYSEILC
jgi:chorismate mutase/prephenate dehydratase